MVKFQVCKGYFSIYSSTKEEWFVVVKGDSFMHLHSDGVIRKGTWNPDTSQYTGWYKTRRLAREAVAQYCLSNTNI